MQKPPGCFSRFGCFSVIVVIIGMVMCLWGWQRTDSRNLPHLSLPSSLPSLLSHNLVLANQPAEAGPQNNQSTGTFLVMGKPTISAAFTNQVLAFYHSPAAGLGQTLYDDGLTSGIDPVFALAFFEHESQFGRIGEARSSLSLGNLRCLAGFLCRDGYAWFASWQQGSEQWYRLIRTRYVAQGLVTLSQIIPVYAPASDGNNVTAYIAAITHDVNTWRKGQVQL